MHNFLQFLAITSGNECESISFFDQCLDFLRIVFFVLSSSIVLHFPIHGSFLWAILCICLLQKRFDYTFNLVNEQLLSIRSSVHFSSISLFLFQCKQSAIGKWRKKTIQSLNFNIYFSKCVSFRFVLFVCSMHQKWCLFTQ